MGARVLLAHFHAIKGSTPFNKIVRGDKDSGKIASESGLEESQIQELRHWGSMIQKHEGTCLIFTWVMILMHVWTV